MVFSLHEEREVREIPNYMFPEIRMEKCVEFKNKIEEL